MPFDRCRLCQTDSDLQLSHILPAFTYRWLRESSGNGHIRNTIEPNKRVQDGLKRYWLCASCEELFSRDETAFANQLFYPYLSESGKAFPYSSWLLRFCTSVSRRLPVILDPDQWTTWLSHHEHQTDMLLPMIHPHDPESMQAWPVSREVNRVGLRDDAGLVEPLPEIK